MRKPLIVVTCNTDLVPTSEDLGIVKKLLVYTFSLIPEEIQKLSFCKTMCHEAAF
jgi:hypothetical protein